MKIFNQNDVQNTVKPNFLRHRVTGSVRLFKAQSNNCPDDRDFRTETSGFCVSGISTL